MPVFEQAIKIGESQLIAIPEGARFEQLHVIATPPAGIPIVIAPRPLEVRVSD